MVVPMPAWDGARGSLGLSLVLAARRVGQQRDGVMCSEYAPRWDVALGAGIRARAPICKPELASVLLDASCHRGCAHYVASLQNRV